MQAKLEILRGAKTKQIRLRLPTVVGRGGDSKLKLPASTVSRHHCEIYEHDGQIVVRDLGSSNGTTVNGHRIKGPTFLTPEDELTIGPLTARISIVEEEQEPVLAELVSYPIAPAEEAAPSMEELPAEEAQPVPAFEPTNGDVTEPTAETEADDASVLQYAEPKSTGRSFVGIVPAEDAKEAPDEAPVFDDSQIGSKPEVNPEDSALNSFFKNLEE